MSREALLAALQRDAGQLLDEVRARGTAQAEDLRHEEAAALQRLRDAEQLHRRSLEAGERQTLLARSRRQALAERLAGEERLQQRLYGLARQLLGELAEQEAATLLGALARELPAAAWQQVTVNPREAESARRLFPQAELQLDADLDGGLRVASAGGRILVDNTLEKRLQRGWPDLLPALLRELEVSGAAASG